MSLKTKLILILLASSVLFGAASLFTQYMIMQQGYQELEDQEAFNNIIRVTESIENEIHHLSQFIYDWAAWNRTYEFIQDVSAEYIEDNLVLTSFTDNKIDLIHYYDTAGRLVWGRTIDLETEEDIELAGIPHGPLPEDHQLFSYDLDNIPLSEVDVSGILLTEKGPMMIASRPILTTESEGPVRGSLVMGKLITEDMVSALSKQTRVDFNIEPIPPSPGPSSVQQENDRSHAVPEYRIAARTTDSLNLESEMPDIQGQPVLLVQANMERKITAQGKITIKYAILSLVIFIVLAAAVVGFLIDKNVVGPVFILSDHVTGVTQSGDLTIRASLNSNNEIGLLSRKFDSMLDEIEESRQKMLDHSFRSGMAEMAAAVLHNIKNTLTGIIGNLDFLRRDLEKTPATAIEKARNELEEMLKQSGEEKRKDDLVRFISLANQDLLTQNANARRSIDDIFQLTGGITSILRDHERWARNDKVPEKTKLLALVNKSVQIMEMGLQYAGANTITITVESNVDEIGTVTVHHFTLLQVLNNVINNGVESIIGQGIGDGRIHVSAAFEKTSLDTQVHLQVSDNGEGMSGETLKHIFERGYSTKEGKSSGIGMHWCANAMIAMGGRMYAESSGLGKGSTIHILFPAR